MSHDQAHISFGRYLRAAREKRGMRIRDVSAMTKISVHFLQDLESEALHRLPEQVYVKGFIRSYAEAVGADEAEAVRLYLEKSRQHHVPSDSKADGETPRSRFWPKLIFFMAGLTGIILASIWALSEFRGHGDPPGKGVLETRESREEEGKARAETVTAHLSKTLPASSTGYLLELKAVSDTRIRVTIDEHGPREYGLKTGDQLALKAASRFDLHIPDPTGIVMKINGNPFTIKGKRGRSVRVTFP